MKFVCYNCVCENNVDNTCPLACEFINSNSNSKVEFDPYLRQLRQYKDYEEFKRLEELRELEDLERFEEYYNWLDFGIC